MHPMHYRRFHEAQMHTPGWRRVIDAFRRGIAVRILDPKNDEIARIWIDPSHYYDILEAIEAARTLRRGQIKKFTSMERRDGAFTEVRAKCFDQPVVEFTFRAPDASRIGRSLVIEELDALESALREVATQHVTETKEAAQ